MDGMKLTLQWAGNETTKQKCFYNGWTREQYVTKFLFLFSPHGKIRCSYFNTPGGLHDSNMAIRSSIYDQIETVYRDTGKKYFWIQHLYRRNHMHCWNRIKIRSMQMVILDKDLVWIAKRP